MLGEFFPVFGVLVVRGWGGWYWELAVGAIGLVYGLCWRLWLPRFKVSRLDDGGQAAAS